MKKKRSFPVGLRTFWLANACLTALCVIAEVFCSRVLHLGYPYDWPLTPRWEYMIDFNMFRDKFLAFHTNDFFNTIPQIQFAYPAPVAVLYRLIYLNRWHWFLVFKLVALAGPVLGAALLWRLVVRRGYSPWTSFAFFGSAVLLSFPLLFELKQGNVEIFIWALVVLGVFAFVRGMGYSAAVCFGIAGSMKIFPLIYLGLLIARKQYRQVFFGFVASAVSTVVSLWLLCPDISIAWQGIQTGVASFQQVIALRVVRREIGFDHSLFSIVKRIVQISGHSPTHAVLTTYMAIVATVGTVLFFTKIIRLPVINQVACLCVASALLPPVSYEYTLIHLYIPWALLVVVALHGSNRKVPVAGLNTALLLLGILVSPLNEFIHWGVTYGGQMKAIVLVALWYVAMKYPFAMPTKVMDEDEANALSVA